VQGVGCRAEGAPVGTGNSKGSSNGVVPITPTTSVPSTGATTGLRNGSELRLKGAGLEV